MMATPRKPDELDIEVHPDAWERFERAVDVVMKSPPKHQSAPPRKPKEPTRDQGASASGEVAFLMAANHSRCSTIKIYMFFNSVGFAQTR